jgi:hypothetical protein
MLADLANALKERFKHLMATMEGVENIKNIDDYNKVDLNDLVGLNSRDELETQSRSDLQTVEVR